MKKKILSSLLMLLLSTTVMVNSMVQETPKTFEPEITQLLTLFTKTAQNSELDDRSPEINAIYLKINPTGQILSDEELTLTLGKISPKDQADILRHGRDSILKYIVREKSNINYGDLQRKFKPVLDELQKTLISEHSPLAACGALAQAACINSDGQVIFPSITKVAKFLALLEEFFDINDAAKQDTKPIAYYFDAWMDLMEDKNGNVLPGLEKLYIFLDTNKTQRTTQGLIKNFNRTFNTELRKPYEFLEDIIIGLLELNPNAPLAEYVDKVLPMMMDKSGQVKPEFKDIYQFVRENKNTKQVVKFIKDFERLNRQARKKDKSAKKVTQYQDGLADLKEYFIRKYPLERLPKHIFAKRLASNIRYLNKLKKEGKTIESRKASTPPPADATQPEPKPTTYQEVPIQETIKDIVYKTLKQHSDALGSTFADNEANIIKELWVGHVAGTALNVQQSLLGEDDSSMYRSIPKAITSYIGTSLSNLPTKLSASMDEQIKVLQTIILQEMEVAKVKLETEEREKLAHTMAIEIINGVVYALITNLGSSHVYTVSASEGYDAMQFMAAELAKLKNQFSELSNEQKVIITELTRKLKEIGPESSPNKQKLEEELKSAQDQKKYLDTVYTALSIKLAIISTADWIASSKLAWPLRFVGKTYANLGYKTMKLFA